MYYAGLKHSTQMDLQTKVARLCTKNGHSQLLTSSQKSVTNSLQKVTDFITKNVTKFITKSY